MLVTNGIILNHARNTVLLRCFKMSFEANGNKKDLVSRVITLALLFLVLLFAVIYIISLNLSLGWFSKSSQVTGENMEIAVSADKYDILVERTNEYETLLEGDVPKYADVPNFKNQLITEDYGYSFTASSTASVTGLAYELVNEETYSESGVDYRFLMPGSYGTMTFYLRPKVAEDIIVNFRLSIGCFEKVYDDGDYVFSKVENPVVLNLLKGHILLFKERRGADAESYKYNGIMSDGRFSYNTAQNVLCNEVGKTDCYKITVFWEWPSLYYDLVDDISETRWEKRYPPELGTFIEQNRACFFASNQSSNDAEELNDGYNDGDQTIGEHASVVTVSMQSE